MITFLRKTIVVFLFALALTPFSASAATIQEIQQQLQVLQTQLLQLQQSQANPSQQTIPASCKDISFDRNLAVGAKGADVLCLQALLNVQPQSGYFGRLTLSAVRTWQAERGLIPATQVGTQSRLLLNALLTAPPVIPVAPVVAQPTLTLEEVVKKALPASVSIIISQDAPQYEVAYENIFNQDWGFGGGIEILMPVYKPTGQTVQRQIGAGSGFIVDPRGYIVTNNHVVFNAAANYTVLMADGTERIAKVIYRDSQKDLAIIKMEGNNFPVESLGDSSLVKLADPLVVLGNAFGQNPNTISTGVISGLNQSVEANDERGNTELLYGLFKTTAPIQRGNSGGPVLDMHGNVIGVTVAMDSVASNISYAIPINDVRSLMLLVIPPQ